DQDARAAVLVLDDDSARAQHAGFLVARARARAREAGQRCERDDCDQARTARAAFELEDACFEIVRGFHAHDARARRDGAKEWTRCYCFSARALRATRSADRACRAT